MDEQYFYPKGNKPGPFGKFMSWILLSMGASSVVDLLEVSVGKNIKAKFLVSDDFSIEFSDARILRDNDGMPLYIIGKTDRIELFKLESPEKLVQIVEENIDKANNNK